MENRRHKRFDINDPESVSLLIDNKYRVKIVDLSISGLAFQFDPLNSGLKFSYGDILNFRLTNPRENEWIELLGEVRWIMYDTIGIEYKSINSSKISIIKHIMSCWDNMVGIQEYNKKY